MCGMCVGMIDLIFKPYVIHPLQLLLDYPLAFGAIGLAGLIFMARKDGLIPRILFGVLCRYICSVISGVVFFGAYVPEGFSPLTWSLWYNILYMGVEAAGTVVLLLIPSVRHSLKRIKSERRSNLQLFAYFISVRCFQYLTGISVFWHLGFVLSLIAMVSKYCFHSF